MNPKGFVSSPSSSENVEKINVFQFDDLCFAYEYAISSISKFDSHFASLELKPPLNSLKYLFLGPDDSLPVMIASDLDRDQEEKLINLLRENKEAIGAL